MSTSPSLQGKATVEGGVLERLPRGNRAEGVPLVVHSNMLIAALALAAGLVIALGWLREAFFARFGTDTALRDLRHFAFDAEHSVPAWFSSVNLLVAAGLLAMIAVFARREGNGHWPHWAILSLGFAGMSVDEGVAFHEALITPLRQGLGLSGVFFFAWVIPGAALVVALGLAYVPFLVRLPRLHARRFVLSGAIFVIGALGVEMIGGALAAADDGRLTSLSYLVVASTEETLEIVGVTLFIASLVQYLREFWPNWDVRLR